LNSHIPQIAFKFAFKRIELIKGRSLRDDADGLVRRFPAPVFSRTAAIWTADSFAARSTSLSAATATISGPGR
jgi:hypothetical protein